MCSGFLSPVGYIAQTRPITTPLKLPFQHCMPLPSSIPSKTKQECIKETAGKVLNDTQKQFEFNLTDISIPGLTKRQCKAVTKSRTRCKNATVNVDGYCDIEAHRKQAAKKGAPKVRCKEVDEMGNQCQELTSNVGGFCETHFAKEISDSIVLDDLVDEAEWEIV